MLIKTKVFDFSSNCSYEPTFTAIYCFNFALYC